MKKAVFLTSVVLGALALAPSAWASPCPGDVSQPFAAYGDFREYTLAPGGDFEAGASGWDLGAGASVQTVDGDGALVLTPGATAKSPPICVTERHPHIRMFAAAERLGLMGLKVDYGSTERRAGMLVADRRFEPTRDLRLWPRRFELDPISGAGTVRVSFTALGGDPFMVDDVYVDPRRFG